MPNFVTKSLRFLRSASVSLFTFGTGRQKYPFLFNTRDIVRAVTESASSARMYAQVQKRLCRDFFTNSRIFRYVEAGRLFLRPQLP